MASRVVDILMEQGRQAAAARLAQGQIWGGAVESLGQLPGQAMQQAAQRKQQQQENAARQTQLGIETAHLGLEQTQEAERVKAVQRTAAGQAKFGQLVKAHSSMDPTTGHVNYDQDAILGGLTDFPEMLPHASDVLKTIDDNFTDTQKKHLALSAQKEESYKNVFGAVANAPESEQAMRYGLMMSSLPPEAKSDPVFGKLPPIFPGAPAVKALYESHQTEAERLLAAKDKAATAKEGRVMIKPGETMIDTGQLDAAGKPTVLASGGVDPKVAETARHNLASEATARTRAATAAAAGAGSTGALSDVKETVAGMKDGTIPPMLPGRATKEYLATLAEARRQGYDLAGAVTDWSATQKHIATLNGAQQTRLQQSINSLPDMLDKVDALSAKWKGGRFPLLNKANLAAAKGGAYGQDVQSVATQLDAQIADVTADLGNVYMGGNSPTDHALGLAAKALSADWSQKTLKDMTDLARNNVQIRSNSIKNTGVAGASATNPYGNQPPQKLTAEELIKKYGGG